MVMDRSSKGLRAVMGPDRRPCMIVGFGSGWSLRTFLGYGIFYNWDLGWTPNQHNNHSTRLVEAIRSLGSYSIQPSRP
jgi:hypothetical protein